MTVLDYPEQTCPMCKGNAWNYLGGTWICGRCHPPVDQKGILRMRLIRGHVVLNKTRLEWMGMTGQERKAASTQWYDAIEVLHGLVRELKIYDTTCLYIENGKKLKKCIPKMGHGIECFACPNDYFWSVEIFDDLGEDVPR